MRHGKKVLIYKLMAHQKKRKAQEGVNKSNTFEEVQNIQRFSSDKSTWGNKIHLTNSNIAGTRF